MTLRTWVSVITVILIAAILYVTRHELAKAWDLMNSVNLWILVATIPLLLLGYFASGEMIFSYLRAKGRLRDISALGQIRLSLELNFVNHIMPSGGASGMTYMTLRLKGYGVRAGNATMAQVVRIVAGFGAFIVLLVVAVFLITIDGNVNRAIILVSSSLVSMMVAVTVVGGYFLIRESRVRKAAKWISNTLNTIVAKVTFGRRPHVLDRQRAERFLLEMHRDFIELRHDKSLLKRPFIWGLVFTLSEVGIYFIVFWALGSVVNPAPILIAYGLATIAGFAVATPGGSGAYEALMIGFLAISGLAQGTALAGVVLARVIILMITLIVGYAFYQHAVAKYRIRYDATDV